MEDIKFSIMTPVYQVEKYIAGCIDSVLAQTYSNFELILVDDGTKDSSGKICDEYAAKDDRIRVFHKQNEGLIATRRFALKKASGDYFLFLDSDDSIKPELLAAVYDTVKRTDADCVIYGVDRVCGGKVEFTLSEEKEVVLTDRRELFRKYFLNNYNALWRKAVRAEVFSGNVDYSPYYKLSYREDVLQSIEILENSKSVAFIPGAYYEYNANPTSICLSPLQQRKTLDTQNTILYKTVEFLKRENVFSEQDFADYRTYCLPLLLRDIDLISVFPIPWKEKKMLLRQMHDSDYFQKFLNAGEYDRSAVKDWELYESFRKGNYFAATWKKSLRARASRLKDKLRK